MGCDGTPQLVNRVASAPADGSRVALAVGVSAFPEKFIAEATGGSMRDATVLLARALVVGQLPGLSAALAAGSISAEHLDVAVRRLRRLEPEVRDRLLLDATGLAAEALWRTPEQYSSFVAERVRLVAGGHNG